MIVLKNSLIELREEIEAEMECSPPIKEMCETCIFLQGLLDIINSFLLETEAETPEGTKTEN